MQCIYGINPILEAVRSNAGKIKEIIIAEGKKGAGIQSIESLSLVKQIPVLYKDKYYVKKMAGCDSHQGVIAFCEPFTYTDLNKVIGGTMGGSGTILILDGITDPQNFGALIRTAHCFGLKGVIIAEDRAASVTPTVIKASAGAVYWIPVIREVNLSRAIERLKEEDFWIYGADICSGRSLEEFSDSGPMALVMGSEGRGLRPSIRQRCDDLLSIQMMGVVGSLNVSVAAGIILYNIMKLQKKGK